MKISEIIANCNLQVVSKGRMNRIGWWEGYLVVEYPPSKTAPVSHYIYGPGVSESERDKLLRVPYPDNLLHKLKVKHNYQSYKVHHAA